MSQGLAKYSMAHQRKTSLRNYTLYDYQSGYIHHCLVDGLEHDTKYYYKLGSGDSSHEFWYITPPEISPDAPYKFGIIGDLGQTYNSLSTLEHYMQGGGQAVLFVGDLSYADRYQYNDIGVRWDTFGRFAEQSTAYQSWIWSAGNHEIDYMPYLKKTMTLFAKRRREHCNQLQLFGMHACGVYGAGGLVFLVCIYMLKGSQLFWYNSQLKTLNFS